MSPSPPLLLPSLLLLLPSVLPTPLLLLPLLRGLPSLPPPPPTRTTDDAVSHAAPVPPVTETTQFLLDLPDVDGMPEWPGGTSFDFRSLLSVKTGENHIKELPASLTPLQVQRA